MGFLSTFALSFSHYDTSTSNSTPFLLAANLCAVSKAFLNEDAQRRLLPMNCISWMVGHLAHQEQFYWSYFPQGKLIRPEIV